MAPAAKTGNRLGLTSGKARGAAARAGGKAGTVKSEPAAAPKAPEPVGEPPERTYPKELLREAEGRPHLNVNDRRYDRLWKETQKQMEYPPSASAACAPTLTCSPQRGHVPDRPYPAGL